MVVVNVDILEYILQYLVQRTTRLNQFAHTFRRLAQHNFLLLMRVFPIDITCQRLINRQRQYQFLIIGTYFNLLQQPRGVFEHFPFQFRRR